MTAIAFVGHDITTMLNIISVNKRSLDKINLFCHLAVLSLLSGITLASFVVGARAASTEDASAFSQTEVNVKSYGAVGDGKADDTDAFLSAVKIAKARSLPVRIPRGKYNISKTIVVDNLEVIGAPSGAWPSDRDALPSLVDKVVDGPCFQLLAGGALHGVDIDYGRPKDANYKYAAILVIGGGVYISNIRIRGAYDGIAADGIHNVGRINVENVFMAGVQHEGIRITGTWDIPRLANVEVWNNSSGGPALHDGVGFHLGKNDGMRMTDCFAFAMHTAYLFEKTGLNAGTLGRTEASMNGCSSDFCVNGVVVNGPDWVSMSGGFFWCHGSAIVVNGADAKVQVTGTLMRCNGGPCVLVEASNAVVVTGCDMTRPMKEHPGPCIVLKGGTTVLGANYLDTFGNGIEVAATVDSANINGNTIISRGGQGLVIAPGANSTPANNTVIVK